VVVDPQLTFRLDSVEDIATGVVFLSVALVVGLLVGQASEDRARASRREREARFLGTLSSTLHTREVPDRVLDEFASVLMEPFALSKVEIDATLDGTDMRAVARANGEAAAGGPRTSVSLLAGDAPIGTLVAERPAGGRPFSRDDQLLLEAAARQATAALDRARLDARARNAQLDAETNQLRAAMFSSVTHDLRTPLASIKAGVTSLLDTAVQHDPAQERELLTTILEETDRLNRLVGNLLDLARIRAGALTPSRQPGAMDEIVEVVLARMRSRLAGHVVTADLPPSLPDVSVDPVQLDQVLTNLLENAGRHAPRGSEIRVSVLWLHGAVQVRVSDEGPGIPLEERDRVFEAFDRGSSIPETPGSGLGLAIAKAVVVAHGGRIWIEDNPGGGCVVAFEIPGEDGIA
jgi:two-component system, OmpR family, sensor histidine kinase KdpD